MVSIARDNDIGIDLSSDLLCLTYLVHFTQITFLSLGTPEQRYADVNSSLAEEVDSFHEKFNEAIEEISKRQDDEKIELDRLRRCYDSWKYRDNFQNIFKLEADLELHRTKKKERAAELKQKKAMMYQKELDFKRRLQYTEKVAVK